MAELADASDLGSGGSTRAGSSPVIRSNFSLLSDAVSGGSTRAGSSPVIRTFVFSDLYKPGNTKRKSIGL